MKIHERQRFVEGSEKQSLEALLKAQGTDYYDAYELAVLACQDDVAAILKERLEKMSLSVNEPDGGKASSFLRKALH